MPIMRYGVCQDETLRQVSVLLSGGELPRRWQDQAEDLEIVREEPAFPGGAQENPGRIGVRMVTRQFRIKTRTVPRRDLKYYGHPLLDKAAHYWPFKRLPGSELFAYAVACLEAILKASEKARADYWELVQMWHKPGCQDLVQEAVESSQDTHIWIQKLVRAIDGGQPSPGWDSLEVVSAKHQSNGDFQSLMDCMRQFVLENFNRKVDWLENNRPKVLLKNSGTLATVIALRSLLDCYEIDLAELDRQRLGEIDTLMKTNPTIREERRLKSRIVKAFKRELFAVRLDDAILAKGELWRDARVVFNSVREAADKWGINPLDLSKRIRLCDYSTGYPLQH